MKRAILTVAVVFLSISLVLAQKKKYDELMTSGKAKFDTKDYSGALVDFTLAIEVRPKEPDAYYQRGLTYYWLYKDDKAIEEYSRAIEVDDKFEKAYFERGYIYLTNNRYEEALPDYKKVTVLNPSNHLAFFNLGLCKYYLQDYPGAISDYSKCLEIDPSYLTAYYNRSLAKYYSGDDTGALIDANKTLELDPGYINAYYQRSLIKYDMGDYNGAILDAEKAIAIDPNFTNAYYQRGLCNYYMGEYKRSLVDFNKVVELSPTYRNAIYNRGLSKHYLEEYAGAIDDFTRVIEIEPLDYEAYYRRGLAHYYKANYSASAQDYQKALEIKPDFESASRELELVKPYIRSDEKPVVNKTETKRMPQIWAVVVGISEYQDKSLNLGYADADAKSVYDFFRSPSGGALDGDHVALLINENATRANIIKALTDKFYRAFENDMIMLFIASHGQPDPVGNEVYFLGHDTDKSNLSGTGVSQIDIEKIFSRSRAKKKIWIADACHSGGAGLSTGGMRGDAEAALINKLLFGMALASDGMAMFTASSSSEYSYENESWGGGHGVFTHYFMEGLKGAGDQNKNGLVEIRELYEYVYRQVSTDTQGKQHPELKGRFDNELPLSVIWD